MSWFSRFRKEAAPAAEPVVRQPPRADWQHLPTLQPILAGPRLLIDPPGFAGGLATWQDPTHLSPLGHYVTPDAPTGTMTVSRAAETGPAVHRYVAGAPAARGPAVVPPPIESVVAESLPAQPAAIETESPADEWVGEPTEVRPLVGDPPIGWSPEEQRVAEVQRAPEEQRVVEVQRAPDAQRVAEVQRAPDAQRVAEVQRAPDMLRATELQQAPGVQRPVEVQRMAEVQRAADAQRATELRQAPGVQRPVEVQRAAGVEGTPEARWGSEVQRASGVQGAVEPVEVRPLVGDVPTGQAPDQQAAEVRQAQAVQRAPDAQRVAEVQRASGVQGAVEPVEVRPLVGDVPAGRGPEERAAEVRRASGVQRAAEVQRVSGVRQDADVQGAVEPVEVRPLVGDVPAGRGPEERAAEVRQAPEVQRASEVQQTSGVQRAPGELAAEARRSAEVRRASGERPAEVQRVPQSADAGLAAGVDGTEPVEVRSLVGDVPIGRLPQERVTDVQRAVGVRVGDAHRAVGVRRVPAERATDAQPMGLGVAVQRGGEHGAARPRPGLGAPLPALPPTAQRSEAAVAPLVGDAPSLLNGGSTDTARRASGTAVRPVYDVGGSGEAIQRVAVEGGWRAAVERAEVVRPPVGSLPPMVQRAAEPPRAPAGAVPISWGASQAPRGPVRATADEQPVRRQTPSIVDTPAAAPGIDARALAVARVLAPAVQRAPEEPPPPPPPAAEPEPPPAPPTAPPAAPAPSGLTPAGKVTVTDELVRALYAPISRLLRAELRLERERAGLLVDTGR